jgi:chlorophyll/bacteriochlorophyll a synthase
MYTSPHVKLARNFNVSHTLSQLPPFSPSRPLVYSLVGLGAGIINDFKSLEGDKAFGLKSIPILLGVHKAKWLAALLPDIVQLSMATYLYSIGEINTAACLLALVVPQVHLQQTLLLSAKDPSQNDVKYMTMTQPLVMLGVIATALCLGEHQWPT